ncbi:MAG: AEC family transporter [Armatimonadota bacterium]
MQARLILMLSVILGALALGYLARKLGLLPAALSRRISRFAMSWLQPPLVALLIWGLEAPGWRTAMLPAILAALIALNWPIGAMGSRLLGLPPARTGSFVLSCMYSNMGLTYGAFVCYILLGERGAALGMVWVLSFTPMFYTLGFFVARRYGGDGAQTPGETLLATLRSPESRNPLIGFALGGLLFALAPNRPQAVEGVVDIWVPISTAVYLFAIGLSMRLSSVVTYWRECAAIGVVKFGVTPALGLTIAWLLGYWAMPDPALRQVVLIQSASPASIMGLVLAQIFDIDEHLANAAWLTTNVAAVALAPVLLQIAAGL